MSGRDTGSTTPATDAVVELTLDDLASIVDAVQFAVEAKSTGSIGQNAGGRAQAIVQQLRCKFDLPDPEQC